MYERAFVLTKNAENSSYIVDQVNGGSGTHEEIAYMCAIKNEKTQNIYSSFLYPFNVQNNKITTQSTRCGVKIKNFVRAMDKCVF